eukprot:TRINITY_DN41643_c0_g1_i1.p1 TRINITY_DN41643_c0_g1~~TRINITY_DN41643_c0_g1_i1.p1  ORF type:complete len:665 (-),score=94.26 TRINITY_DN41643_c0_g1_i1:83-2077(-)
MEGEVYEGVVKYFAEQKGYGHVTCEELSKDPLLLRSELRGFTVDSGQKVTFQTRDTDRGPHAVCVRLVSDEPDGVWCLGALKDWNAAKGFGFLGSEGAQEEFGRDVFVMRSDFQAGIIPQVGMPCQFQAVNGDRGPRVVGQITVRGMPGMVLPSRPAVAPATEDEVEEFLDKNPVEEHAEKRFRDLDPTLQKLVINRGSLKSARDPTGAFIGRIVAIEREYQDKPEFSAGIGIDQFLKDNPVEPHAERRLRELDPMLQRLVISRGSMSGTRDPTACLIGRIVKVEKEPVPMDFQILLPAMAAMAPPAEGKPGDWICSECGDHQFARNQTCRRCGAGAPSKLGRVPIDNFAPGDWICAACGDHQFAKNDVCRQCRAPRPPPGSAPPLGLGGTAAGMPSRLAPSALLSQQSSMPSLPPMSSDDERLYGCVKIVNSGAGWAKIRSALLSKIMGKDEIMILGKALEKAPEIFEKDLVSFRIQPGQSGKDPHAVDIRLIDPGVQDRRFLGRVRTYNEEKGWGFIDCGEATDIFGADVFIHKNELLPGQVVRLGDEMEFSVDVEKRGKAQAIDVVYLGGGQGPVGPGRGREPAGPARGRGPVGPGPGREPAGPRRGRTPAGPGIGQPRGASASSRKPVEPAGPPRARPRPSMASHLVNGPPASRNRASPY